ncbi:MAG TPA: selenocysteine-specific translation elongation factor [Acidobacteriaceae bacterium]|nr:selenocysteine-specific translation elongation factor [Acidobacteriaceae bacterium]
MQLTSVQPKSLVIGTAGHIDHGKTTLVRALTGIDTDRLPEEKRRSITIDLGFASLDTQDADGSPLRLSFVDVPGHKLFIRNMLAGAGCIGAVMLVISAEEGIKPQTEEHLAICSLLGIRRGLTVVTKADAVSPLRLDAVCRDVTRFLTDTFLNKNDARILPVSARSGQGLEEVRRELVTVAANTPVGSSDRLPRLPLDRAFVMKGFGPVVTGTLLSGTFHIGQTIAIEPGNLPARVRGMQTHGRAEEQARAGSRVGLNLAGIEISDVYRGQIVVAPETLAPTAMIDVEATLLPGCAELKHRSRVHFHAFTSDTLATVSLYGYHSAEPGTSRVMRLSLNKPVVLLPGDRFVLRQCSPAMTIGGGRLLDAHPLSRLRKEKCVAWLEEMKDASVEEQLRLRVARRDTEGLSLHALSAETGLRTETIQQLTAPLIASKKLLRIPGDVLLAGEALEAATERIMDQLKIKSSSNNGLKRSELKGHTGLSAEIFSFVLEKLSHDRRLQLQGESVYPSGAYPQLPESDQTMLSAIAAIYEAAGLTSPSASEVANNLALNESEMRRLMTLLLRKKILVKMGSENLFMHSNALAKLRGQLRDLRGQTIDVAFFKEKTGLSRKYAIPLLEYLDRERITLKKGDARLIL